MKEIKGDLWEYSKNGYVCCITTNNTLNKYKEIVMGGGCAGEASSRYPLLPKKFAKILTNNFAHKPGNKVVYFQEYNLVMFPTKNNVWQDSTIELIKQSCLELMDLAREHNWGKVILPRPGAGLGGLDWETEVKPVIAPLLGDEIYIISPED